MTIDAYFNITRHNVLMYRFAGFFSESRAGFNSNFCLNKTIEWLAKDHMKPTFVVSTNYTI